jgi:hypothetical protein
MSLISFHRFLIVSGIVFCFGFAVWELMTWWVGRQQNSLILGVVFILLGGGLIFYLSRLKSFLGIDSGSANGARRPR